MGSVRVQVEAFDAGAEIDAIRAGRPGVGAVAAFVGVARDVNEGARVDTMTLEHYPGMTERALQKIADEARARWNLQDVTIVHRVGTLRPTEPIVLVVTAAAHRHEAFESCSYVMDYLKTEAPFWKKEATAEGERWVDARESDDRARDRWEQDPAVQVQARADRTGR